MFDFWRNQNNRIALTPAIEASANFSFAQKVLSDSNILESSVTYMRVLRLLEEASTKMIHKNWLSFISHVLRTSSIHESFVEHHLDSKGGNPDILKVQSQQILEAIPFSSRRDVFRSLLKGISVGGERITSENHIPNYLMYTTIGRADLVDFEVYHETLSKSVETQRETE